MSGPLPDNALLAWLQDESNDEFRGTEALTTMYAFFATGATSPLDRLQEDDRHHSFLIFVEDDQEEVTGVLLHHLAQFPSRLGATATAYDGKWFFTADQPIGGNHITYLLPSDLMEEVDAAQCYKPARIQRELAHQLDATKLVVETSDANLEDLESIITRRGMWIPNEYAKLCLGGLSPAEIWTRVYGAILQNGHVAACKPLVEFLQYQIQGSVEFNMALYDEQTDLTQPRASAVFLRHRNHVLSHLQPTRAPQGASAGGSGQTTPNATGNANAAGGSATVGGLTFEQLQALIAAIQGGSTPTTSKSPGNPSSQINTVEKRWAVDLNTLLKLCMVTDVADLPPVWAALAQGPRKEERQILQAAINNRAASAGSATRARLVVTKELHNTIVNLVFWSGDMDMLDEGLHPFRTVYTSAAKQAQDQSRLRTYDALTRDGTIRLEDLELFQLVLKSHWPTDFLQLDTSLKFFQNLLTVLLPATHPLVIAYVNFLGSWNELQIPLAEYFATDAAKPALFLRSVQLRTAAYWQKVTQVTPQTAPLVKAPDYGALLASLLIQSWVLPTMPGVSLPPLLDQSRAAGGGAPPFSPLAGHSPYPGPTPPSAPAPAPSPAPSPAPRQTEVRNPSVDPQIAAAMSGRTFRIASLFNRTVRPPKHDDGVEICCSYHWRGKCSSGCGRHRSHRPLTKAERVRNLDFLQEHVVTPDLGRAPPTSGGSGN